MRPILFQIPLPSGAGVVLYYVVFMLTGAAFNACTTWFGGERAQRPPRREVLKSLVWGLGVGLLMAAAAHYFHHLQEQEFAALRARHESNPNSELAGQIAEHPFNPKLRAIPIHSFGTMLALGAVVAIALTVRRARKNNTVQPEMILDLGLVALLGGIVGARMLYFLQYPQHFGEDAGSKFVSLLQIWRGGLVYYGGLMGGVLAVLLYAKFRGGGWLRSEGIARPSVMRVLDVTAPAVVMGQAFGRVGCFMNGCCWGLGVGAGFPLACSFPRGSEAWKQHLEFGWIDVTAERSLHVHPTQLYAVGYCLLIYLFLEYMYYRRRTFEGRISALVLLTYPVFRFVNEYFRNDNPSFARDLIAWMPSLGTGSLRWPWFLDVESVFGHVSGSQVISVVLLLAGVAMYVGLSYAGRQASAEGAPDARAPTGARAAG